MRLKTQMLCFSKSRFLLINFRLIIGVSERSNLYQKLVSVNATCLEDKGWHLLQEIGESE